MPVRGVTDQFIWFGREPSPVFRVLQPAYTVRPCALLPADTPSAFTNDDPVNLGSENETFGFIWWRTVDRGAREHTHTHTTPKSG